MLDIKFICDNTDWVKQSLGKKGFPAAKVDELIAAYLDLNKLKTASQALAEEKNKLSNSIKSAPAEEKAAIIAKSKSIRREPTGSRRMLFTPSMGRIFQKGP